MCVCECVWINWLKKDERRYHSFFSFSMAVCRDKGNDGKRVWIPSRLRQSIACSIWKKKKINPAHGYSAGNAIVICQKKVRTKTYLPSMMTFSTKIVKASIYDDDDDEIPFNSGVLCCVCQYIAILNDWSRTIGDRFDINMKVKDDWDAVCSTWPISVGNDFTPLWSHLADFLSFLVFSLYLVAD